jgi:predicted O-methyltransferase YrrM
MSREYSRFVVLVLSRPDDQNLSKPERDIMAGLQNKWAQNHDDPNLERMDIIFVDHNDIDTPHDLEKYKPLTQLDRKSLIYVIGHSNPGEHLQSNKDAYEDGPKYFEQKILQHYYGNILLQTGKHFLHVNLGSLVILQADYFEL